MVIAELFEKIVSLKLKFDSLFSTKKDKLNLTDFSETSNLNKRVELKTANEAC